jgi:lipopolysaccharide/colanic/teichoic acid biosynthesis glycosyltransferase
MTCEKDENGNLLPDEKRLTKYGKILRSTSLDELPELFNIFIGDMSIVGPRPERIEHVEKYSEEIPEFVCRYKVKGGLTGYAQVFGKYNTSAYNKLKMDLIYIQNYSLFLDFKLILMTVKILFKKESTEGFDVKRKNQK